MTIKALKRKWGKRGGFSAEFWKHIIAKLNTEEDHGVYSFARVETVIKDPMNTDKMEAWRAVWKATSICEKLYDLAKSRTIDLSETENNAYCPNRSTQRALTKVACWNIKKNEGLLGIDYKNAFGRVYRPCINNLLGMEFLNSEIEFEVATQAGTSAPAKSKTGSGAGRGSGGPGFIVPHEFHLNTNETAKKYRDDTSAYADDSLVKTEIIVDAIKKVIDAFRDGEDLGLFMHGSGKKGPTILVQTGQLESTKTMIERHENEFGCDVNVVDRVKFLGLEIFLCDKDEVMLARFTEKIEQLLSFFIAEINRAVRIIQFTKNTTLLNNMFNAASQSIASLIESRFQYAICFLDRKTMATVYMYTICIEKLYAL